MKILDTDIETAEINRISVQLKSKITIDLVCKLSGSHRAIAGELCFFDINKHSIKMTANPWFGTIVDLGFTKEKTSSSCSVENTENEFFLRDKTGSMIKVDANSMAFNIKRRY